MDIDIAKNLVIKAGKELVSSNLIARTWGNVSCRIDNESFVITPTGRTYNNLTTKEIVKVNIEDLNYEGNIKPSSEKKIHSEVYKQFKDANFVIHTHQLYGSIISAIGVDSIMIDKKYNDLNGQILCAEYGLPSTSTLYKNVRQALQITKNKAIIMKNHGIVCWGKDYEEAFLIANTLEKSCEEYINNYYLNLEKNLKKQNGKYYSILLSYKNNEKMQLMCNRENKEIDIKYMGGKKESNYETICKEILNLIPSINTVLMDNSPELLGIANEVVKVVPILDDFAQIAGTKVRVVENNTEEIIKALKKSPMVLVRGIGAICCGVSFDEVDALRLVAKKNCKAIIIAKLFGQVNYIDKFHATLMRFVYLKKYSKEALK